MLKQSYKAPALSFHLATLDQPAGIVSLPKLSLFKEGMSKFILGEGNQTQVPPALA